jgi:transcriptional regulator with XRE-family HTH domain
MDTGKVFVRNMKKYRKRAGVSQEKLAELCGASHSYIRQLECGSKQPSFSFIDRLASALNTTPALLLYDETRNKEEIEAALLKDLVQNVHTAFSRL